MEHAVLALRDAHPAWGGRKIHVRLRVLGHRAVPSPSTITMILRRHGRLELGEPASHQAWQMAVPASRYQPSPRSFPDVLPPIEYGPDDIVRTVQAEGLISYRS